MSPARRSSAQRTGFFVIGFGATIGTALLLGNPVERALAEIESSRRSPRPASSTSVLIEDSLFTEQVNVTGPQNDGIVFRNCSFVGITSIGLDASQIVNGTVENCSFTDIAGSGIWLRDNSTGWTIRNCTFQNIGRNGVLASESAASVHIEDCTFTDVAIDSTGEKRHGVYLQSPEFLVENNTFTRIYDGNGISVRSTGTVRGNVVDQIGLLGQQSDAIKYFPDHPAGPSQTLVIENNIVWDPSKHGIEIDADKPDSLNYAENVIIRFNTILIRDGAHVLHGVPLGIDIDNDVADKSVLVYGNLIVNEVEGLEDTSSDPPNADVAVDNRLFASNPGLFVDWAGENFHILNNALVVDAAASVPGFPALDVDGTARPANGVADIGADELAPVTYTLVPTHDSYVRGGTTANVNYDNDGFLRVKNASGDINDRHTFVRFSLSGIQPPVLSATFQLYMEALPDGIPSAAHVYSVTNDTWTETTITWNNQPAAGNLLTQNTNLSTPGQYYSFDVSSFAAGQASGDGQVSLMLRDDSIVRRAADFDRREDQNPPRLNIVSFPAQQYNLTLNLAGAGQVQTTPPGPAYLVGTAVTATAIPAPNWGFQAWNGVLTGVQNPQSFVMSGNLNLGATFVQLGPGQFEELALATPPIASSVQGGNVAAQSVDGLLSTRWQANGNGQWIRFDLGDFADPVAAVWIAWHQGNLRTYTFDLQASNNGQSWTAMLTGSTSTGATILPELYAVAPTPARYWRIVGHGNSLDLGIGITELDLLAAVDAVTGANEVPRTLRLWQNVPNPFNPTTTIQYELGRAGRARLCLYDIAGRLVRTLVDEPQPAGSYAIAWQGTDNHGRRVPSGVYHARLESAQLVRTIKLCILQ